MGVFLKPMKKTRKTKSESAKKGTGVNLGAWPERGQRKGRRKPRAKVPGPISVYLPGDRAKVGTGKLPQR